MEDAYGIGIENRYAFLLDTEANDPQAILKEKAKKAKRAAKKLAGKENTENDAKVVANKPEKLEDEKKVKLVVPGKGGKQPPPQHEPQQKSRSMKDTQNIQGTDNNQFGNGFSGPKNNFDRDRNSRNNRKYENRENRNNENGNGNNENGVGQPRNNFDRDRNYGNNRNYENRENREQGYYRRNKEGGTETGTDAGHRTSQENGPQNRGNRMNGYRNNETSNNVQESENNSEFNNRRDQDGDRPARRQGYGNRRYDGQRRNYDGRGGQREFDRHSGSDKTGVKAIEKREGGGAHNWGTHKQDIEDLNKVTSDVDLKEDGNSVENAKSEENLATVEEVMTLDEYKQRIGQRAKPVYNTRKAGEGEDRKKWKNLVPLQKKKEDKSEDEFDIDMSQYPQRKRGIRYIVDINIRFNEANRPGFNNRRRNNRRDNEGRRNDTANRQNAPQVDERNFPSLG